MRPYDLIIAGSGPIGAATAYFLTRDHPELKIALITEEPTDHTTATYTQAGGSLHWPSADEQLQEMIRETDDFVRALARDGVDITLTEDKYQTLPTGETLASLSFSITKVVHNLLQQATGHGLEVIPDAKITSVEGHEHGVRITAGDKKYSAKRILLALGAVNAEFMPDYELERVKRQLFVLDLPVPAGKSAAKPTIARIGDGDVSVSVEQTPAGSRYVVGQAGLIEDNEDGPSDYFADLLAAGVEEIFPFLHGAKAEQIRWGYDAGNETLQIERRGKLWAANCGSAARAAAWIGRTLAEKLSA